MNDTKEDDVPARETGDGRPKFGRLLIVLALAVMLIGALTLSAEALYS
ncbi:hypothetical protein [Janthinobacterium fluminis]|uniref:Uncharacterized protein n=1 Tax=Janthinobacterium fluminis TaxID=2987524 RepID=A0ABT5K1Q9_9BURK|nr:hypothetical protein [Janthinobacterium fluminis]MDC8758911.1 hypothetical protein [Janthinobacterium fluminis]